MIFAENMRKKFDTSLIPPHPDLSFEEALWKNGMSLVVGLDEAGRGAWAGPVHAAAVILPDDNNIALSLAGVNDSKKLSVDEREALAIKIKSAAVSWNIGSSSPAEIDSLGILPATILAMERALAGLSVLPGHLLVDYLHLPNRIEPQTALVKGDARSLSIASASILAKTARDAEMIRLSRVFPGFGFEKHKGYGTSLHSKQLNILGPSTIHRRSFLPVRSIAQMMSSGE